jgi:uncharacterized protein (TIGR02246 family)
MKQTLGRAAALLLLVFAWPSWSLAQAPASSAADRAALEQLNAAWLKSYETRDPTAFQRVMSPDFIGIYGDRAMSKAQMLEGLKTRPPTKVTFEDLRIHVTGDTAVVTAISTVTLSRPEGETAARYRYADVYLRRDGNWQAVASHVVPFVGRP